MAKVDWDIYYYISDLSDHLPVFTCFALKNPKRHEPNVSNYRIVNADRAEQFKNLLANRNWERVTMASKAADANGAYELFLKVYKEAYDKAFPLVSNKQNSEKPKFKQLRMTLGLLRA